MAPEHQDAAASASSSITLKPALARLGLSQRTRTLWSPQNEHKVSMKQG